MINQLLDMLITIVVFFGCIGAFFATFHIVGKVGMWAENKLNKNK